MSELRSKEEYESIKAQHRAIAREKEKKIKRDLSRLLSDATPRYLREKLVTSCIIFGSVYLVEEILFKKRVPGIVKFAGAVSAAAFAPKLYRLLYRNFAAPPPAVYPPSSNGSPEVPAVQ
jgi:hypothetical protein